MRKPLILREHADEVEDQVEVLPPGVAEANTTYFRGFSAMICANCVQDT
jgi:hypothetical protein